MISRLGFPLGLNYLSVVHMDGRLSDTVSEETSFTRNFGHVKLISALEDGFNVYYPIAMVVVVTLTYFRACGRYAKLGRELACIHCSEACAELPRLLERRRS
jgi:hypothetical protein